jgi:sugar-phosphatase
LFDMDGTLVDSTAMVEQLWAEFAAANGADRDEVIDFAHGRPSRDTIARFTVPADDRDRWMAWISDSEATQFEGTLALPGAVALTRAMPPGRWAIVTSAMRRPARARSGAVGIPAPPVLIAADDVAHGKPSPEPYRDAASALGLDSEDCVVFEDAPAGVEAGLAAGCTVVVVGELDTPVVAGLARVPDLSHVSAVLDGHEIVLGLATT